MSGEKRIFWSVVAVAVVVVAALVAWPRVEQRVAPRPTAAWVAIEVEGSGVARVGPVSIDAGTPFTLHAVLEAVTRRGDTIYYTEAPGLMFPDREVGAEALRRWPGGREARVLWFTVEGPSRFLELSSAAGLERFRFAEFLRSDWPFAWAVRGRLGAGNEEARSSAGGDAELPFGTQRFQVRIELYGRESTVMPQQRFISWGREMLPDHSAEFPTVHAALSGPPRAASEVFGLTQIEIAGKEGSSSSPGGGELRGTLVELTRERLAFSRVPLLAEVLAAADVAADELPWQPVTLGGTLAWGGEISAGDLLRAGGRVVVLYRDAAPADAGDGPVGAAVPAAASGPGDGRLDGDDLCLDYVRGASVRRLSEVFDLSAGGSLAWAPLGSSPSSTRQPVGERGEEGEGVLETAGAIAEEP
ncbi:MAG TPA: hypothetical protein VM617_02090 [Thermoanaerobaculia bacterium]|nr:hypothetical protein [Thermoanaerobaculia bacterium]